MPAYTIRAGTLADSRAVFSIFQESVLDLSRRTGAMGIAGGQDPATLENLWEERRPLFEHMARTADQFWIAEEAEQPIGYARAILRSGVRELTEFFVLPGVQSAGVGRALLERAFTDDGADHRIVIASLDPRAQVRYLKAGVYPRFSIYYFSRTPEPVAVPTDLRIEPITATAETLALLAELDQTILGHQREVDQRWLLETRTGFLYYRASQPVGYGYIGQRSGPFALLDPRDFPAVLAHAETLIAERGWQFGLDVPLVNHHAVDYLLKRGCRIDAFMMQMMSDKALTGFERYLCTTPSFFI